MAWHCIEWVSPAWSELAIASYPRQPSMTQGVGAVLHTKAGADDVGLVTKTVPGTKPSGLGNTRNKTFALAAPNLDLGVLLGLEEASPKSKTGHPSSLGAVSLIGWVGNNLYTAQGGPIHRRG